MKKLHISYHGKRCGVLAETDTKHVYSFTYDEGYQGTPISLTMPIQQESFIFKGFPPFFDGLLPEGIALEELLHHHCINSDDYMSQLEAIGSDLIGAVTAYSFKENK